MPTFEDAVIPATSERTSEYLVDKAVRLHAASVARLQETKKAFDERLDRRKAGGATAEEDTDEYQRMVAENRREDEEAAALAAGAATDEDNDDSTMVLRDAEVRGQAFFACSFVVDPAEPYEDLFVVYAAFDRQETATRYVNDTLSDYEDTRHLFVCTCYEWIYPSMIEDRRVMKSIPCAYKHGLLDDIMQRQFSQKGAVAEFERSEEQYKAEQAAIQDKEEDGKKIS